MGGEEYETERNLVRKNENIIEMKTNSKLVEMEERDKKKMDDEI